MKMIRGFNEQQNITTAKRKVYTNVTFPNGFMKFTDALITERLADPNYERKITDTGYYWTDSVRSGGITLETSSHPLLTSSKKQIDTVTVLGSRDSLAIFERLLELHQVEYDGQTKPEDIDINIEYHDELNPVLWNYVDEEYELKSDVAKALDVAADAFFEFLDLPELEVQDITVTGSSANYNWTSSSDLDLHIIVDMSEAEEQYGPLVSGYFEAKKKVWNDMHDIKIKNIPVEFYIQDSEEEHQSTGVYSLKDEMWVLEPKFEEPNVDDSAVQVKAAQWMNMIDDVLSHCNKADTVEKLMTKLRTLRKAGLEKGGEFSVENLAFKALRNRGYLDRLADCKTKIFDRELSIEEEEWSELF